MVFYFSGTGNTQWVAEELARTIGADRILFPRSRMAAARQRETFY